MSAATQGKGTKSGAPSLSKLKSLRSHPQCPERVPSTTLRAWRRHGFVRDAGIPCPYGGHAHSLIELTALGGEELSTQ